LIQNTKSAFIFPAFINEYPANPFGGLQELHYRFQFLLQESSFFDPDLAEFDFESNDFLWDELKTQYLTYIYSCAVAEVLNDKRLIPLYSAGYSMGIYAALFQAKVINFADGLLLIKKAFETMRNIVGADKFGMCSIIGLSREDINDLICSRNFQVEITNQNSSFAFVLSGLQKDMQDFLKAAMAEGALHTHLLNVSLPYHSGFLKKTMSGFREFVETIRFSIPRTKIISLVDQQIVENQQDLKEEIVRNLYTPLNWYRTQSELIRSGVNLFIECGPGKNLVKNSKFIEGDFQFSGLPGFLK
jgi:[acyl-carrier-protein] S-malonyltransferase